MHVVVRVVLPCRYLQDMVGTEWRLTTASLTRPRQVYPLDAVIMTQQTAFSPLMINGKQLTIKNAEAIASEVMEHATRRNLKCKWGKCGGIYGSIYLLERVSGLEKVTRFGSLELVAYQARTCFQDG